MRLALFIAAASLIAAACGSASSTPQSAGVSPGSGAASASPATPSAAPSDGTAPAASNAAGQSPAPGASGSHMAPDLEALLPTQVDEISLSTESATGASVFDPEDPTSQGMIGFLASHNKVPADLVFAQAYDPTGALDLFLAAFRVEGLDPVTLRDALIGVGLANGSEQTLSTVTLAGRSITKVVYPTGGSSSYLYEHDGVVFDVESKDEALVTQVLGQLP